MVTRRHRIRCSVGGVPVEAWEGVPVLDVVETSHPGVIHEVLAGRVKVVDGMGRTADLEPSAADGDVLAIVPIPHPGRKRIQRPRRG
jgi:hypothetical protein